MNTRTPGRWWQRTALFGFVYLALGVTSAVFSNPLRSEVGQASIRVGILLIAIAVFCGHWSLEVARSPENSGACALRSSGAVAWGTFLMAVYANLMAWRESPGESTALLPALVIWPLATGVPAFLAALTLGVIRAGFRKRVS